jgi:hypothetical protein
MIRFFDVDPVYSHFENSLVHFIICYIYILHTAQSVSNIMTSISISIYSVAQAVDFETERLYDECRAYQRALGVEEERLRTWSKAVHVVSSSGWNPPEEEGEDTTTTTKDTTTTTTNTSIMTMNMMQQTIESFQKEIQILQDACQQQEQDEWTHLQTLYQEQVAISHQLDALQLQQATEWNRLKLHGRAFDGDQATQTKQLQRILREVQTLEQVDLLQHVMMEWKIPPQQQAQQPQQRLVVNDPFQQQQPQQQQFYPRVNDLRLAFAASSSSPTTPHDDSPLDWEELEAAWSLVAQCVLWIAALTNFSSQEWRIVPLTKGPAKLIQYHQQQQPQQQYGKSHPDPKSARPSARSNNTTSSSSASSSQPQQVVVVYNLGRPNMAKSLCAFQVLLHQLTEHVMHLIHLQRQRIDLDDDKDDPDASTTTTTRTALPSPYPPFSSTPTQIGSISLENLLLASTKSSSEDDDEAMYSSITPTAHSHHQHHQHWSQIIYYMACNIKWLCDQTASLLQV